MLEAQPRASLTLPSCSPNYPRASRIGWTLARYCPFLNLEVFCYVNSVLLSRNLTETWSKCKSEFYISVGQTNFFIGRMRLINVDSLQEIRISVGVKSENGLKDDDLKISTLVPC